MDKRPRNEWIVESESTVLDTPIMKVTQQLCHSSEDGRKHRFFRLKARDWCNIIPVTEDGRVVMVRQFRVGSGTHTLEIPGGVSDPGDSDMQATAIREMTEETGYAPLPGAQCIHVGTTLPNPAIQDNRCHSFVIGPVGLVQSQKLDPGEMIEVVAVPIDELIGELEHGKIDHALIAKALLTLAFKQPAARQALAERLRGFTKR